MNYENTILKKLHETLTSKKQEVEYIILSEKLSLEDYRYYAGLYDAITTTILSMASITEEIKEKNRGDFNVSSWDRP